MASCSSGGGTSSLPTFRISGYVFRFYSSDRFEPPHVHVLRDSNEAKFWLSPIALQHNHGYTQGELREVVGLVAENAKRFLEAWDGYFADFQS